MALETKQLENDELERIFSEVPPDLEFRLREMEESFLKGEPSKWDEILISMAPDNTFSRPCLERGFWLTRARRMEADKTEPYVDDAIGMKQTVEAGGEDLSNRWGQMLYLSNDLTNKTAFKEIEAYKYKKVTLGYFFIKEHLNLLDATEPRAVATFEHPYGRTDVSTAMSALVYLIDKWFNVSKKADGNNAYKITNHVASLLRDHTELDGIIYRSSKTNSKTCWNIALVKPDKVVNCYSDLYEQVTGYKFRKTAYKIAENGEYTDCLSYTQSLLELMNFPTISHQWKALKQHEFP